MINKPDNFTLAELVCPHVYKKYGETCWQFLNSRLLLTIDLVRVRLNKRVIINNWKVGGNFDERGFRCIQCSSVKDYIGRDELNVSAHTTGQAVDFEVEGLVAEEVRQWIVSNKNLWPYPIRLENDRSWIHLDVRDAGEKVVLFNP